MKYSVKMAGMKSRFIIGSVRQKFGKTAKVLFLVKNLVYEIIQIGGRNFTLLGTNWANAAHGSSYL
jgi:hypothetical protein